MTNNGEFILYNTEDGATTVRLKAENGTVWLSQRDMADLFDKDVRTINEHLQNIYDEGECDAGATIRKFRIVQTEGSREVAREVDVYSLEPILAVGFRVRSPRGTQFRRWANSTLREYLVKGFVMDDERLKDPQYDYFDELLERIRDIRASEVRLYHKVRDILALSTDYDGGTKTARDFYAMIQNKMLYAVTSHTAAELVAIRSDPEAPNMGLTAWKRQRVSKADVSTAKNYLGDLEIRDLNRIVSMFLDTAELRAERRQTIFLREWEGILDRFLESNELHVLRGSGQMTANRAEAIAHRRYEQFDAARKAEERRIAESESDIDVSAALGKVDKAIRDTRRQAPSRGRGTGKKA